MGPNSKKFEWEEFFCYVETSKFFYPNFFPLVINGLVVIFVYDLINSVFLFFINGLL